MTFPKLLVKTPTPTNNPNPTSTGTYGGGSSASSTASAAMAAGADVNTAAVVSCGSSGRRLRIGELSAQAHDVVMQNSKTHLIAMYICMFYFLLRTDPLFVLFVLLTVEAEKKQRKSEIRVHRRNVRTVLVRIDNAELYHNSTHDI